MKEIPGYPGYQITRQGKVFSYRSRFQEKRELKGYVREKGYRHVMLSSNGKRKNLKVARLVLIAFVGPPPYPEAHSRHLDGNAKNDNLENLAWGTPQQNIDDQKSIREDKMKPGIRGHVSSRQAAEHLGISACQVTRYCKDGSLESVKLEGRWLIKKVSLRNFRRRPAGNPDFQKSP